MSQKLHVRGLKKMVKTELEGSYLHEFGYICTYIGIVKKTQR